MRIHTYVIAIDAGSAPNYDPPFVTLAVCKPRIRKKASAGDCVIAFAGAGINPTDPHAVVWAGVVAETMPFADYWHDQRFANKKPNRCPMPDNFYRPASNGFAWIPNPVHGPESQERDAGGVNVLVFDPSWRFGANGPAMPESFGLRMTGGRRGERLANISESAWQKLEAWFNAKSPANSLTATEPSKCRPRRAGTRRSRC